MSEQHQRTAMLIGEDRLLRLQNAHVAVFGIGGVGSYTLEALVRAGIGHISIIDSDAVVPSNLNRQLIALYETLGMKKVEAAKKRALSINPDLKIDCYPVFVLPENLPALMQKLGRPDFVVDAIDTVTAKLALITYCKEQDIPVISCCGTGNKLHPELFELSDIYKTSVCPLCKVLRRELKERGIRELTVCYSREQPVKTGSRTPASISFVPGTAGLIIAGHVIRELTEIS